MTREKQMTDNNWGPALQGTGKPFEGYQKGEEWQCRSGLDYQCSLEYQWGAVEHFTPFFYEGHQFRFRPDSGVYKALGLSITADRYATLEKEYNAFKQEVSDMASAYIKHAFTVQEQHLTGHKVTVGFEKRSDASAWFDQLLSLPKRIISMPAPKPDPLEKVMRVFEGICDRMAPSLEREKNLRAAMDALGFEIREKDDDQ